MGFGAFIFMAIVIMALAWLGVWALGKIAPGHPQIVDTIIWVVGVVIIVIMLFNATGISSHDPQIPKIN